MASLFRFSSRLGLLRPRCKLLQLSAICGKQTMTRPQQIVALPLFNRNSIHSGLSSQQLSGTVSKTDPPGLPHWKTFRYVSVLMIGLYPAALLAPTPVVDWGIAIFFPLHSYWGTKEILSDYIPQIFSNKAVKTTAVYTWAGVSFLTFVGLAYLNIADVGVCKAVSMLWKL